MQPLYPLENSKLNGCVISTFRFNLQIKVYCVFVNLCINAIWYTVIRTREYNDENDNDRR